MIPLIEKKCLHIYISITYTSIIIQAYKINFRVTTLHFLYTYLIDMYNHLEVEIADLEFN